MVKKKKEKDSYKEFKEDHPIILKKINETLKTSVKEGSYVSISNGLGISYFAPFALAMQATTSQIGILHATATLLPSISQLGCCKLIEKYSRKKIIISGVLIKALLWIPIMLTALLYFNNVSSTIWILITLIGLYYIASGTIHPAWFSLMGSLVPGKERGKYFSQRNKAMQFFSIISMIISAIFLDYMKKTGSTTGEMIGYTFLGFTILFTLAMLTMLYSAVLIKKHYEPKLKIAKKDQLSLLKFLKNARNNPFGRFAIFNASFWLAIGIASPFFVVYMLKELNLSYTWYILIIISSVMFQIIFLTLIGKVSDKFGNILLTKLSATCISITPLLWAASYFIEGDLTTKLYLVFVAQLVNGIGWAGFNLATNNFVYDSMNQARQGYALAYMNLFIGVGAFVGAIIGTIIVKLDILMMNIDIIIIIFFISFIARSMVAIIGSRYLTEVKKVDKFKAYFLVHEFHPLRETITEVHHLNHLGAKIIHYN